MTNDELDKLMLRSGLRFGYSFSRSQLVTFAKLIEEQEREACAKIAEENLEDEPYGHAEFRCVNIANTIRDRSVI